MSYVKMLGERVSLAVVAPDDAGKLTEWLNDLAVTIPLGDEAYSSITLEKIAKEIQYTGDTGGHVFSIIANESGLPIGRCLLFNVDFVNRSAKLGIFIGEKACWNQGFGKEALNLLLEYAFHLLNLNSVMLGAFEFNERAIRCYQSVGFKEIGRRRQARLIGGRYYDAVMMDMLAEEFHGSRVLQHIGQ